MRPEDLQVNLRPRSSWEAIELGTALLRRHAAAVWRPWLLVMLLALAMANLVAWALGAPWLALLLCWWLKPALERVPLYVLSRAVFGQVPGTSATVRALPRFAPGSLAGDLSWRRAAPARSLLVPVDVLEGNPRSRRAARRQAVAAHVYPQAVVLTAVSLAFELALALGCVALVALSVPPDLLPSSLRAVGHSLEWPPPTWLWRVLNLLAWTAALVIGPFYVAAGFGMYLNRRTGSEAWDVELAFRRLRQRLLARGGPLLLALAAALPLAARADDGPADAPPSAPAGEAAEEAPPTLPRVFGEALQEDAPFRRASARAWQDPRLTRERTRVVWRPRRPDTPDAAPELPQWLASLAGVFALIAEFGLWLLLGAVLLVLLLTARRWWPWLQRRAWTRRPRERAAVVGLEAGQAPEALPPDVPAVAARLWAQGHRRQALGLLYRASVAAMAERAGIELPPGATEAQCLRAATALEPDTARELFTRTVRTWQYAAYAGRLPDGPAFHALLDQARACWGWRA